MTRPTAPKTFLVTAPLAFAALLAQHPARAVVHGAYEAVMGIASGIVADTGNGLSGAREQGSAEAVSGILGSPVVGDGGVFSCVGSTAWLIAVSGAIVALRQAGAGRASLVLLGLGGLVVFHAFVIGPVALVCLAAAAYVVERRRPRTLRTQSFSNRPSVSSSARAAWKASQAG